MTQRVAGLFFAVSLITGAAIANAQVRAEDRREMRHDHECLATRLNLAQATADLARTEGDLARIDQDEECDLACAALERHRDILMSEIRDYYKTLREHACGVKENE